MCKRSTAYLTGIQLTSEVYRYFDRYKLPCNSFQCPECSPYLTKQLRARIFNGDMVKNVADLPKYSAKFVTFTCPGIEGGRYEKDPKQWLKIMQENFNRLMTAIRKRYGRMYYLRVTEPHKDGIPHLHVLFVSAKIQEKKFLKYIESLWCGLYRMGFVKAKVIYDLTHGVYYITKYLTKGITSLKKHQRIFSTGRNTIMKKIKKENKWIGCRNVVFGCMEDDGKIYEMPVSTAQALGIAEAMEKCSSYEELTEMMDLIIESNKKGRI
jgi:hypothetical protein